MNTANALDRLSSLLENFRFRAHLYYSGTLCGVNRFDADSGKGFLHVLRQGSLDISHPHHPTLPKRLTIEAPCLLFYPQPLTHWFHNPPEEGSDFTCAAIEFEGGTHNPLACALPPFLLLDLNHIEGLSQTLSLLFAETDRLRCGQRLLADRLFEVVLIQLLRWLLDHPQAAGVHAGLLTGLSDARLARSLTAMHNAPYEAWNLEKMADYAGMSRSAFASHFKQVLGQTPADYLTNWRITLAQSQLRAGKSLKLLADELGYANPSALSRAFAAKTGLSPRDWLKQLSTPHTYPMTQPLELK